MPLPAENTPWPPPATHSAELREYDAWYSSDPDKLSNVYGGSAATPTTRPAQLAGGVVGRAARWWWGQPTPSGEQRTKLHVPLAADICGTSADLLFSEPLQLGAEDAKVQEFLEALQEDGLDAKLHEGAEVGAALGGTYLRTVWDTELSPRPWTEIAHPDGAVPVWRGGRLQSVSLWSQLDDHGGKGTVWRWVEHHEPGSIGHALYAGTVSNLGKIKPLQDHPATEHLALRVDAESREATNVQNLTVAYVPNMLPNRLHRTSPHGRSDLQGVTPWLDALDEAYSSWWRDIRVAKARLHVPAQYLEAQGAGMGASVDLDREVYVPMAGVLATSGDKLLIDAQQFKIRVDEHRDTCQAWTDRIIESAGYSTQSLSSGTGGAVTAAEVHSHERRSYMTRGKKIRYWTQAMRQHLATQLQVAQAIGAGVTAGDFTVEFADGVQESTMALAQTSLAMRNAESASTRTRVKMMHPDWQDTEVDAEVAAIMRENSQGEPVPNPDDAGL